VWWKVDVDVEDDVNACAGKCLRCRWFLGFGADAMVWSARAGGGEVQVYILKSVRTLILSC
jgi:hypothetical protein